MPVDVEQRVFGAALHRREHLAKALFDLAA